LILQWPFSPWGSIPEKHFSELLTGYDTEQETLDREIERLQSEIDRYNTDSVRADQLIELVKRHTEFTEFSAALLNEFVEKVIVHEADKSSGQRIQKIDVYLNYIGKFELPEIAEEQAQEETKSTRRPRTERDREYDRQRYAKKVAAKKAADEAARAAILQGTSYEIQPEETQKRKTA